MTNRQPSTKIQIVDTLDGLETRTSIGFAAGRG
jgi:hypothetical protein